MPSVTPRPSSSDPGTGPALGDAEFEGFRKLFHDLIGIHLGDPKKHLVASRLAPRLRALGLPGFHPYLELLRSGRDKDELQRAVDLITTNETWFFREADHFEILRKEILPTVAQRPVRLWCAAASTGEEPYSLAMTLHDELGARGWSLVASDINVEVLDRARAGLYPIQRARSIPPEHLRTYCLRGVGENEGRLLVRQFLREAVDFRRLNLLSPSPDLVDLDVVFLRNVLIYFDAADRQRILSDVARRLRPGGWLVLGHSESTAGLDLPALRTMRPSIHRKLSGPDAPERPWSPRCPSPS